MEDSVKGGSDASHDAFKVLSDPVRLDIIRTLGDARDTRTRELSFSELQDRVSADVRSGRFNYHLNEILGRFVTKTEDGYRLRSRGIQLYRLLRAGDLTTDVDAAPVDAGVTCYFCGRDLQARFPDDRFVIRCADCAHTFVSTSVPPAVHDGDSADVLRRVGYLVNHQLYEIGRGVCQTCGGDLATELGEPDAHDGDFSHRTVVVFQRCDHCNSMHRTSVGTALLFHPRLISFCWKHGLDVLGTPIWKLEFAATDRGVTIVSTDPWVVRFEVSLDDETLTLTVDDDLTVSSATVD